MSKINNSVVIPVYNQYEQLKKVLNGFKEQTVDSDEYEIVIVDDGSTDLLSKERGVVLCEKYNLNIELIHQKNSGRAVARNKGVQYSRGKRIIFCDADRIPYINFVREHMWKKINRKEVIIGNSYDYFGSYKKIEESKFDWNYILKMSRNPIFYKKIQNYYLEEKNNNGEFIWLAYLAGNSSIDKEIFQRLGGFNEIFKERGFEHYELGYRLYKYGINFIINNKIFSFHIPHKRKKNFYKIQIEKNINLMKSIHPELETSFLTNFFGIGDD